MPATSGVMCLANTKVPFDIFTSRIDPRVVLIGRVSQIHYSGTDDPIVPPAIAQRFTQASASACVRWMTMPGADHENGWTGLWREALEVVPNCD